MLLFSNTIRASTGVALLEVEIDLGKSKKINSTTPDDASVGTFGLPYDLPYGVRQKGHLARPPSCLARVIRVVLQAVHSLLFLTQFG